MHKQGGLLWTIEEILSFIRQRMGKTSIDVKLENETVWLTQAQMADLFQKDRTVIGRHINNVYREGELERDITCAKFAHVGSDNDQQYVCSTYVNDCRKPDGRKRT